MDGKLAITSASAPVGSVTFTFIRSPDSGEIIGMRDSSGQVRLLPCTPTGIQRSLQGRGRPGQTTALQAVEVDGSDSGGGSYVSDLPQLAGVEVNGSSVPKPDYWSNTLLPADVGVEFNHGDAAHGGVPIPDPGPEKAARCQADTNSCLLQAGDIAGLATAACGPIGQEIVKKLPRWSAVPLGVALTACVKGAEDLRDRARAPCFEKHVDGMNGG